MAEFGKLWYAHRKYKNGRITHEELISIFDECMPELKDHIRTGDAFLLECLRVVPRYLTLGPKIRKHLGVEE